MLQSTKLTTIQKKILKIYTGTITVKKDQFNSLLKQILLKV